MKKMIGIFGSCRPALVFLIALGLPGAIAQTVSLTGGKLLVDTDIPSLERQIKPNRMVILDYSGSMRSVSAGGEKKLYQLARDAANMLVRGASKVDPDAKTGLIIFGNRHPNAVENITGKSESERAAIKLRSCNDINVELAYGTFSTASKTKMDLVFEKLGAEDEGYRPQGESPVMAAIKKASDLMDDGGSIILITDFNEAICSRKKSLCDRYSEISETLVKRHLFLTHVVALERQPRANETAATQLNQLAEIKKFTQCTAAKAKTIQREGSGNGGARQVVREIEKELKEASKPAIIEAKIVFDGNPVIVPDLGNVSFPAYYLISTRQDDDRKLNIDRHDATIEIAPGIARVTAVIADQKLGDGKEFNAVRSLAKKLNFHLGTTKIKFGLSDVEGREISGKRSVQWTVKLDNKFVEIDGIANQEFELLRLPHQITARFDGKIAQYDFRPREEGETQTIILKISAGGSPSVTSNLEYDQGGAFPPASAGRNIVLKNTATGQISKIPAWKSSQVFVLPGTYSITVNSPNGRIDLGLIKVDGNDRLSIKGKIPMPQLAVQTNSPSARIKWTLTGRDSKQKSFTGPQLLQGLPPGKYRLVAETDTMRGDKNIEIVLGAGLQSVELEMDEF